MVASGQELVVSVAEAKAHLSELLSAVEAGGIVTISRRGKPVARVSAVDRVREPIDVAALRRLTAGQPVAAASSGDVLRRMREDARY